MIEALLRDCRDVEGVARLFDAMGYPVRVREVDAESLSTIGLTPGEPTVHHLTRFGGVDLYAARSATESDSRRLRELVDRLSERNHVLRSVVVELGSSGGPTLSIHGRCGGARRRLDIDVDAPSSDTIDRLCGLVIRGREKHEVDPGALFERALDREAIGRRFFEQFRRSVGRVAGELAARHPDEPESECRDEALLLLSRVLFVYLIQRKGWLDGDHRFLRERLEECRRVGRSFHASVVRPLFFDCLNRPKHRRPTAAKRLGRIPYLNGGLFEPSRFEQRHEEPGLSNEVWKEVLESTFEPFSLSVSEGDEEGTHIDPEMLGNVFEKLMEGEERARTGSFYTPRAVVDCLTTAAIVKWCAEEDASMAEELRALLEGRDTAIGRTAASRLIRRLETITVLDPACGSGAFLLSALRTIEALTRALARLAGKEAPRDLRAAIAAGSLYGVDLKPEAVRLCELRIWLAIVSESSLDVDSVPPLPNLDRNVMQGNSLVGPLDFLATERPGVYRDWVRAMREREELLDAYRRSTSSRRKRLAARLRRSDLALAREMLTRSIEADETECRVLRESDRGLFEGAPPIAEGEIERLGDRLRSKQLMLERLERQELCFFSFDLHFATVLARGGFSVVLGNPPWVRASRLDGEFRRMLADRFRSFAPAGGTGFRQAELATAFVEHALRLAAPDGVIAQVLPSKVTSADYAAETRRQLLSEASVEEVYDWSTEGRSLFGADVFPLGLVASKRSSDAPIVFRSRDETCTIERSAISVDGPGSAWSTVAPDVREIFERMRERHEPLREALGRRPVMGVKTGANGSYFIDDVEIVEDRIRLSSSGLELPTCGVVRVVRGRDVRQWRAVDSTWMLWPAGINGDRKLASAVARELGLATALPRLSYVKSEHLGLKVAWKDVSRGMAAAVLPERTTIGQISFLVVPNQTLYSIDVATREEGLVLAAMLNSTVVNALALETAERAKDHHWRYLSTVIASVPLPRIDAGGEAWRALAKAGRRAEAGEEDRAELNRLVSRLYGVSSAELARLERFVASRLGKNGDDRI